MASGAGRLWYVLPPAPMLALHLAAYAVALWLGCTLLARRPLTGPLLFTGSGLAAYAAALACGAMADALGPAGPADGAAWLDRVSRPLALVPAACWCAALAGLASGAERRRRLGAVLSGAAWAAAGAVAAGALVVWPLVGTASPPRWLAWLDAGASGIALLALLAQAVRARRAIPLPGARSLALLSPLFFGLGGGLMLLQVPWLPRSLLLLASGADLLVFGWVVAALDALDAGERLRAGLTRSAAAAASLAVVFGGQVALALALGAGPPAALVALLVGVLAAAVGVAVFWDPLQRALDQMVFGVGSPLSQRRAALLAAASDLPRQPAGDDPLALSEEEFTALTRRALSHFGDLPRLAASPLTRLPAIDRRLRDRGASGDILERAAELKALLAESIARLKPADAGEFGTTDEWRHYNALYFPYVAGLRPYSRRPAPDQGRTGAGGAPDAAGDALRWFRAQVPERTLHNWQRAAARLVAVDLRERGRTQLAPELAADGSTFPSDGSAARRTIAPSPHRKAPLT